MYSELSLILIKNLGGQCDIHYGYLAYVNDCHMKENWMLQTCDFIQNMWYVMLSKQYLTSFLKIRWLHYAHSGVVSTLSQARECIYWPGMSSEIKQFIETCDVCRAYDKRRPKENKRRPKETLIPHERPWAKVGVDLFSYKSRNYLICVDYYSSFWEIDLLEDTWSATVIRKLKAQCTRHGIPETCVSDNGSQFISDEFKEFSRHWSFAHMTSSPTYSQSNGKVEAAIKSAKSVMKKSRKAKTDPYLALLEYRNTPSPGMESSPVVRLMNRRTRTQVPTLPRLLIPVVDHNVHNKLLQLSLGLYLQN